MYANAMVVNVDTRAAVVETSGSCAMQDLLGEQSVIMGSPATWGTECNSQDLWLVLPVDCCSVCKCMPCLTRYTPRLLWLKLLAG